jgi:5-methylcytosine-specific restriction endonuclease McrA
MPAPKPISPRSLAVLTLCGRACRYCGGEADTIDHIVPRRLGGTDREENLTAACRGCNSSKNGRRLTAAIEVEVRAEAFVRADLVRALAAEIRHAQDEVAHRRGIRFGVSGS